MSGIMRPKPGDGRGDGTIKPGDNAAPLGAKLGDRPGDARGEGTPSGWTRGFCGGGQSPFCSNVAS